MNIQDLLIKLHSLCDDENLYFSYYNDVAGQCYIFRFGKHNKAIKLRISYIDLKYKVEQIIMAEINRTLLELYKDLRNSK